MAIDVEHPSLSFIVQDLERVVVAAEKDYLDNDDMGRRMSFIVHYVFDPHPAHGADM